MKFMVAGDSISHGREGDWTWRYRLWEWLTSQGIQFKYVGPYKGTAPPEVPKPPQPPVPDGEAAQADEQRPEGGYARGVSADFEGNHFAAWGLQAFQEISLIEDAVRKYQPDFLLIELGFNDIGWGVSDASGTLGSMRSVIENARAAKPDIKFAIANIPHRTFLRDDLPISTNKYNRLLKIAVPVWSTPKSPIALVQFCENYSCGLKSAPAAYDGLHPNALGEFQIARAFSETLNRFYGIGVAPLDIPKKIPERPTPVPSHIKALAIPGGIKVTWDAVYGAMGYDIHNRRVGKSDWDMASVSFNRHDTNLTSDGEEIEYRIRTTNGEGIASEWSETVSAVSHPETAAPPSSIILFTTGHDITVSWTKPTGRFSESVNLYLVIFHDDGTPGAWPGAKAVRGLTAVLSDLQPNHNYTIMIQSWNAAGGSLLSPAQTIKVGG